MTAEQQIIQFLDIAGAYLRSGYKRQTAKITFPAGSFVATADNVSVAPPSAAKSAAPETAPVASAAYGEQSAPDEHPRHTPASFMPPALASQAPPVLSVPPDQAAVAAGLEAIAAQVRACTACPLHETRTNAVPGEGVCAPLVMVIGEGPGENEDKSGRPFVGEAGQLLDKMLASIGLSREQNCFIANVVKCRPPHNRDPLPVEAAACASFLAGQIALLQPRVILCAGRVATQNMLKTSNSIKNLHGHFIDCTGIPLFPMYHPSALLHDPSLKRPTWDDLKTLRTRLNELEKNTLAPS
jgi:DNA polymerase